MTKHDLARRVGDKTASTQLLTSEIVQKTLDAIVNSLIAERRVELRGFGIFQVRRRSSRSGRNPRTGEKVHIPEKLVVTFTPGKETRLRIRNIETAGGACRDAA